MTMQRGTPFDRILPELFAELADARTPAYLEAAIERASSRPQRPAWTYPGRWLPGPTATDTHPTARGPWALLAVLALIGVLIALATAAYVGSRPAPTVTVPPLGPAGNGAIALGKDGDIFVADRPGGDLLPLVAGPEDDRSPMFSPDGTRLAFIRDTHPGSFLMVADADGTNVVAIPLEPTELGYWSFAPDGRSLVAVGYVDDENELGNETKRVYVIRPVDPAAPLNVLDIPFRDSSQELYESGGPSFRPTDADEILVVAQLEPDGPRGIHVYDLATGGIRTIVQPAGYVFDVAWLSDGEHIIYSLSPGGTRVVAADGSGDRAFDALRGRVSPFSNDGTRIVAERGGEGVQSGRPVIVPINGEGEPVVLACGSGTDIECPQPPTNWIWSPDDSMLIGTVYHETSSSGGGPLTETNLLVDARTGQLTELDWRDVGTPAWQRVAP
jgi:hypothetical protein